MKRTRVRSIYGHVEYSGSCAGHKTFEHSGLAGKAKAAFQLGSLFSLNGILFLGEDSPPQGWLFYSPFRVPRNPMSLWSFCVVLPIQSTALPTLHALLHRRISPTSPRFLCPRSHYLDFLLCPKRYSCRRQPVEREQSLTTAPHTPEVQLQLRMGTAGNSSPPLATLATSEKTVEVPCGHSSKGCWWSCRPEAKPL